MPNQPSEMKLDTWLQRLESLHPMEIELGLGRIVEVAKKLPLTDIAHRVITVAGTNGKGSTICLLAAILEAAGLKVGCYTSPHLLRYNERVRVNGQALSDEAFCDAFLRVERARGEIPLTYFEFGTLAAFDLFARADLDLAILEVGLGGRLDATNIIDSDMAIVTSIALDHQDWLGDNRDSIAYEKSGIMRAGAPVICGDPEPPLTLIHHAESLVAQLDCQGQQFGYKVVAQESGPATEWDWWGHQHKQSIQYQHLPLPSVHLNNAATAIQALMHLQLPIEEHHIREGLLQARLPGRYQRIEAPVPIILDVAHNPQAAEYLMQQLSRENITGNVYALLGMLQDKDCDGIIQAMLPVIDHWSVCDLNTHRAMGGQEIAAKLSKYGCKANFYPSVVDGIKDLNESLSAEDLLLVFGSFYTVSSALQWLN